MASLVGLGVPPALALPLLMNCLGVLDKCCLEKLSLHLAGHDARHFSVDPLSLLLIEDRAAFEGVDGDEPEPFEEIPVVDGVVAPLKEVALIWVVVLDEHFPFLIFLTKEGARMRNYLMIEEAGTYDKDLPECVGGGQFVFNELLETGVGLLVPGIKPNDLNDRKNIIALHKKFSKGSDRHTIIDLLGIDIAFACTQ